MNKNKIIDGKLIVNLTDAVKRSKQEEKRNKKKRMEESAITKTLITRWEFTDGGKESKTSKTKQNMERKKQEKQKK